MFLCRCTMHLVRFRFVCTALHTEFQYWICVWLVRLQFWMHHVFCDISVLWMPCPQRPVPALQQCRSVESDSPNACTRCVFELLNLALGLWPRLTITNKCGHTF